MSILNDLTNNQLKKGDEILVEKQRFIANKIINSLQLKNNNKKNTNEISNGRIKKHTNLYRKSLQNRLKGRFSYFAVKLEEERRTIGLQTPYETLIEQIGSVLLEECELQKKSEKGIKMVPERDEGNDTEKHREPIDQYCVKVEKLTKMFRNISVSTDKYV
ncbi:hypothetical protein ABEB36_007651 [Hypothenemus hampei]|uniref:Uncharacterized protein n=1 Tax=Hypothenemus hampei TaxID=57062 RepID=A0ABD1EUN9_HYPHA